MTVNIERRSSYVVITLDQPNTLDALSFEMLGKLREAFEQIETDTTVRCVILNGAGNQAFFAGSRLTHSKEIDENGERRLFDDVQALCDRIEKCRVPVIAAVNGRATGIGCNLAFACQLRIAATNASFSLLETRLGGIPNGAQRLAFEIGRDRALEIMLTGETVLAEEALQIGLINRVAANGHVLAEAELLALEISRQAPLAVSACLEAVARGAELPLAEGLALEAHIFSSLFATNDMREGTRAFLDKRPPVFKGT